MAILLYLYISFVLFSDVPECWEQSLAQNRAHTCDLSDEKIDVSTHICEMRRVAVQKEPSTCLFQIKFPYIERKRDKEEGKKEETWAGRD